MRGSKLATGARVPRRDDCRLRPHAPRSSLHARACDTPYCTRGYNIGVRLIDEFLAKAQIGTCSNFADTAEVIAKIGFKMFLGITAEVVIGGTHEFSLQLTENPLAEFVELPEQYGSLAYSNMLCGDAYTRAPSTTTATAIASLALASPKPAPRPCSLKPSRRNASVICPV